MVDKGRGSTQLVRILIDLGYIGLSGCRVGFISIIALVKYIITVQGHVPTHESS